MKTSWMWSAVLGTALVIAVRPAAASAQLTGDDARAREIVPALGTAAGEGPFLQSNWSGPRVGFMVAPGDAAISRRLKEHGLSNIVSEFGWQFEHVVTPVRGGPRLVTEVIPLFGGVEYGKFVPTVTAVVGVRFPSGFEFGAGPSLTLVNTDGRSNVGLLLAAGKSIEFGDVCIPVNLAISTNPQGTMITLISGYSMKEFRR